MSDNLNNSNSFPGLRKYSSVPDLTRKDNDGNTFEYSFPDSPKFANSQQKKRGNGCCLPNVIDIILQLHKLQKQMRQLQNESSELQKRMASLLRKERHWMVAFSKR